MNVGDYMEVAVYCQHQLRQRGTLNMRRVDGVRPMMWDVDYRDDTHDIRWRHPFWETAVIDLYKLVFRWQTGQEATDAHE